jgi:POTRA domain, FtsQ-type
MIRSGRKFKNRRHGREHVLDVKLRSDQVRATRVRLASVALGMTVVTLLGFYLLWRTGQWTLDRLIYENSAFAIQKIELHSDGVIADAQLRHWTGVKLGENLLALDVARVKRNLELISAVRSVVVERVLPHTLRLRVAAREPVAQISALRLRTDGGPELSSLQLDADGYVLTPLAPGQLANPAARANSVLPAICGVNPNDIMPGKKTPSPQIHAALRLVSAFQHSPMAGVADLQLIDLSSPGVLVATTSRQSKIVFSVEQDPDQQLRRWRAIYDEALGAGKVIATLDLSVPDNIPAVLVPAAGAPPAGPKTGNLQPTRKKNV